MKKLFSISIFILFTGLIIGLVTCKSDPPDDPINTGLPLLTVTVSPVVSSPADVAPGEVYNFRIEAKSSTTTLKEILKLEFLVKYSAGGDSNKTFNQLATEKTAMNRDTAFKIPSNAHDGDQITIIIKVTDKANQVKTSTWVFKVVIYNTVNTDTMIVLGSHFNTTNGSFYSTTMRQVYFLGDAFNNQAKIDFCYFYASPDAGTIAAPTDTKAKTMFNQITIGLPSWLSANATILRKMSKLTQAEFNALDANMLQSKYSTAQGPPLSKAISLFDGAEGEQSFIAFKTYSPVKYGVIRVDNVDVNNQETGTIIISVKVQK